MEPGPLKLQIERGLELLPRWTLRNLFLLERSVSFQPIAESMSTSERSQDVNRPSHLIGFQLHKILSQPCYWDDRRITIQFLDAAVNINEIAQYKLALTPGGFVSLLFFLALHGGRRRQEKDPALIVRTQKGSTKAQRGYDQRDMRWELERGMPCRKPHYMHYT
jgi:hypothetical protein